MIAKSIPEKVSIDFNTRKLNNPYDIYGYWIFNRENSYFYSINDAAIVISDYNKVDKESDIVFNVNSLKYRNIIENIWFTIDGEDNFPKLNRLYKINDNYGIVKLYKIPEKYKKVSKYDSMENLYIDNIGFYILLLERKKDSLNRLFCYNLAEMYDIVERYIDFGCDVLNIQDEIVLYNVKEERVYYVELVK